MQLLNGLIIHSHLMPHAESAIQKITETIKEDTEAEFQRRIEQVEQAQRRALNAQVQNPLDQMRAILNLRPQRRLQKQRMRSQQANIATMMNAMTLMALGSSSNSRF